jgi:hypothetical protein
VFDVSHNPIEQIGEDFFKNHASIDTLSFYDCHLKKVANGSLDYLTNLDKIYFDHNVCIDLRREDVSVTTYETADEIKAEIYDKCVGSSYKLRPENVEICMSNKNSEKLISDDAVLSSDWTPMFVTLLVLTTLVNIVFAVLLIRIFKRNFGSNWQEMKNVII